MKQCPQCRSTYTDDGLRFCLTDGSELIPIADEQETVVGGRGRQSPQTDLLQPRPDSTEASQSPQSNGRVLGKIIAVAGVLGVILVIGVIGFVFIVYLASRAKT